MSQECCICGKKINFLNFGEYLEGDLGKENGWPICDDCLIQKRFLEFYKSDEKMKEAIDYFNSIVRQNKMDEAVGNIVNCKIEKAVKELSDIYQKREMKKEELKKKEEEYKQIIEKKNENEKSIIVNHMITTSNSFEGYRITKYLGLVSGEVVLGTGFLSEMSAGLSDFFGGQSASFAKKIKQAKKAAESKLIENVVEQGGNAVIGVEFDYITLGMNMIGVCVNGTAVIVQCEIE